MMDICECGQKRPTINLHHPRGWNMADVEVTVTCPNCHRKYRAGLIHSDMRPGDFGRDASLHDQVIEFHQTFCPDQGLGKGPPAIPHVDVVRCRFNLITEEYFEALSSILPFSLNALPHDLFNFQAQAWNNLTLARQAIDDTVKKWGGNAVDLVELADALADLDYVVEGTRIAFSIDGKPIADEVHRSNMSKIGGHRREDGKWEKPETYSKADIEGELRKQGWKLMEKRTLELSYEEAAHLGAILLHEREVSQTLVDGQPRKTGGVTGQIPVIDGLIRKLHEVYPEQNWIRFLR